MKFQIPLKAARISCGYSVKEIAKKIGVSESTIRRWESDSSNVTLEIVLKLKELYSVPLEFIYFGSIADCAEHNRKISLESAKQWA